MSNNENHDDTKALSDENSFRDLIQSLMEGRKSRELRRYSRFPARNSIVPESELSSSLEDRREGFSTRATSDLSSRATAKPAMEVRGLKDLILPFDVIDFSEQGLQVRTNAVNVLLLSSSEISLRVRGFSIPVELKWYKPEEKKARIGLGFAADPFCSLGAANLLVDLSDDLLDYMLSPKAHIAFVDAGSACGFTALAILINLRFRLIQAIAACRSKKNNGCKESDTAACGDASRQVEDCPPRYVGFSGGGETDLMSSVLRDHIRSFLKLSPKLEICFLHEGAEVYFSRREILQVLADCLVPNKEDYNSLMSGKSNGEVISKYFSCVSRNYPRIVEELLLMREFIHYSASILRTRAMMNEAIDILIKIN